MPTRLPVAPARACRQQYLPNPLLLSCAAIGAASTALALFVCVACDDGLGAVLIISMVVVFIGILLRNSTITKPR